MNRYIHANVKKSRKLPVETLNLKYFVQSEAVFISS
jgi:hypothetical protein